MPGHDVVIHAAARAHVMQDGAQDPLAEYRATNVEATLTLARSSVEAGVQRFVFISSIKVNGEHTAPGAPFLPSDLLAPMDAYGQSKQEAEAELRALLQASSTQWVIIRPPLVYGPGVKGNFRSLIKLAASGLPLPLGSINNQRSLVYLDNLVDLIIRVLDHPKAQGQIFLVSDGNDISTSDLLRKLRMAMGRPTRLISVPPILFRVLGILSGKTEAVDRLCGSLQVDIGKTCDQLSWQPPFSIDEGLRETVAGAVNLR